VTCQSLRWLRIVIVRALTVAFALLVVEFVAAVPAAEPQPDAAASSAGQKLFTHQFRAQDPLTPGGDGLGPLHNEVSCAGCHRQKGIGGAGPLQKNVDVIIRLPITGQQSEKSRQERASRAADLHPGLASNPSQGVATVLHRSATTEGYAAWRAKLLGAKLSDRASFADVVRAEEALDDRLRRAAGSVEFKTQGVAMQRVQRSTPALFGAGLIDQIPDAVIREQAQSLAHRSLGIQGVVPTAVPERPDPLGDPNQIQNQPRAVAGKFGWRGQTGSLRQFVLNACANELGLEIPNHAQPTHPQRTDYSPPGFDLTRQQCEELIEFVAQLPRPRQELPSDPADRQLVERGEALFNRIGCAACHVKNLGNVDGLYSDLLLHDLGKDLSDFAGANPSRPFSSGGIPGLNFTSMNFEQLVQFYTGGVFTESPELRQKWKTPPLWGVRDSAPYLHDGRASTLDDAIRLHAGEAKQVTQAYKALSGMEREQLLAFLKTLAAPAVPPVNSPL
jgi:CxxC motif-containing protein (DUF1111 family)